MVFRKKRNTYSSLSDVELFSLLKDSSESEKAFGELYNRHSPRVLAYCKRIMGNDEQAEDIFQETFMKFFRTGSEDRVMTNVPAFILRIARNLCLNAKRSQRPMLELEDFRLEDSSAKNRYEQNELLELIRTTLELLDFSHREVFILREYEGYSHAEIAEITGESVPAVKTRASRARKKIRSILKPYLQELES